MKTIAYKFQFHRNKFRNVFVALSVITVFSLFSCSEDDAGSLIGFGSNGIHFSIDADDAVQTRAGNMNAPRCTNVNIHELESPEGETFFLEESDFDGFFNNQVGNAPVTRGIPVESVGAMGDFSTFCYHADETAYYENIAAGNDGLLKQNQRWPEDESLRFYAIHPYDATASGFSPSAADFKCTYTVSTDVPSQSDLMYASTGMLDYNENRLAPLHFRHALTAVKVKIGTIGSSVAKINSITFKNVKTKGTLSLPASDGTGTWVLDDGSEYTKDIAVADLSITNMAPDTEITSNENTFFMLPQSLDDVSVEIGTTLSDNSDHTFSLPLAGGSDWEAGKTRVYTFTTAATMAVSYPEGWEDATNGSSVQGPVSQYDQLESFGLFSVDPSTGKIVLSNVEVKNLSSGSVSSLKLDDTKFYAYGNTYFLYYPYKSDSALTALVGNSYEAGQRAPSTASAEDFFASLRTNWAVSATQNTLSAFKAQDLQTAILDYSSHKFAMDHQMGLAQLQTTMFIEDTWVWTYNSQTTHDVYTESKEAPDEVTIDKSKLDAATKARLYDESGLWTIVRATGSSSNESVALACNFSNDDVQLFIEGTDVNNDEWSATESGIGYGKYKEIIPNVNHIPRKFRADFNYNASKTYYSIKLPRNNQTYKLEAYGGGYVINKGRGGYTYGKYHYASGGSLYVCVGGKGTGSGSSLFKAGTGGFNGGGDGSQGGGGATHIADQLVGTGTLRSYYSADKSIFELQKDYILIVAGGGAGYDDGIPGQGGGGNRNGTKGDISKIATYINATWRNTTTGASERCYSRFWQDKEGKGGTQEAGGGGFRAGDFGIGGNAIDNRYNNSAGAGGGGWYGGGSSYCPTGNYYDTYVSSQYSPASRGAGGGGSGHINTNKVTIIDDGQEGGVTGGNTTDDNGRARISWPVE